MPVKAYMYDEWGNPLSSEPQYFASGGAALEAQARLDAQRHDQKQSQYSYDPVTGQMRGPTPISRGDMAAAGDAQQQYFNQQQNSMYQALMGMLGGNNGMTSAMGGGWTPGSTMVGGGGPAGGGAGAAMPNNPTAGWTGGSAYGRGGATGTAAGPQGGSRTFSPPPTGQGSPGAPGTGGGMPTPGQQPQQGYGNYGAMNQGMTAGVGRGTAALPPNFSQLEGWQQAAIQKARANGGPIPHFQSAMEKQQSKASNVNSANQAATYGGPGGLQNGGGGEFAGGVQGGANGSSNSSGGQQFGAAFETALYDSFNKPGWDPEPVINKGTEEIAYGEQNALTNLGNRAANQGVEGGAVQAGAREVISDFAGKRANLARDTRAAAARDADQSRLTALNAAGSYLGRAQDNARSDRNAMMQLMMQNLNNRQSQATDFSTAMQAPRPTLAPLGGSGNAGKQKDSYAASYGTNTPQPVHRGLR